MLKQVHHLARGSRKGATNETLSKRLDHQLRSSTLIHERMSEIILGVRHASNEAPSSKARLDSFPIAIPPTAFSHFSTSTPFSLSLSLLPSQHPTPPSPRCCELSRSSSSPRSLSLLSKYLILPFQRTMTLNSSMCIHRFPTFIHFGSSPPTSRTFHPPYTLPSHFQFDLENVVHDKMKKISGYVDCKEWREPGGYSK